MNDETLLPGQWPREVRQALLDIQRAYNAERQKLDRAYQQQSYELKVIYEARLKAVIAAYDATPKR